MTPEERKQLDETIADLRLPEPAAEEAAPVAQDATEELQEVNVDLGELPDLPDQTPKPINDIQEAFKDGAGEVVAQVNKPQTEWEKAANERMQEVEIRDDIGEVEVPLPDDRHERAKQKVPGLEAFMRDMRRKGKLDKEGFIKDDPEEVALDPEDVEDLREAAQKDPGDALMMYVRKDEEWKAEVVRAIETLAMISSLHTAQLRVITDGLIREQT